MKYSHLISLLSAAFLSPGVHSQTASNTAEEQLAITAFPALSSDLGIPVSVNFSGILPGARASAPALTSMMVFAVGSTNCNWEKTVGKTWTVCDHGGPILRVAVLEIGYGSNPFAWMNSGILPQSKRYSTDAVCFKNNSYYWPCDPGQTIVGWLNYYQLDGHQNGRFQYQNTSSNQPWNTMQVRIGIL